ncbi:hypothetical protein [Rhodopirellula bahusiensis]|uniref:GHMP family kinase ATP-binding protein n=2 Tax=Rhodopirellula bahusiensis TaxID=2014065 RepID=UPI003264B237
MHTATIALNLRTLVTATPCEEKIVKVTLGEETSKFVDHLPFVGDCALINACITHFGIKGVHLNCQFDAPAFSGLGGSSTLSVAICAALMKANDPSTEIDDSFRHQCALKAYLIENGIIAPTGLQDQLTAAYGGLHLFRWKLTQDELYTRRCLLPREDHDKLKKLLVTAYTGERHSSSFATSLMMRSFCRGGSARTKWLDSNNSTVRFANAVENKDWQLAIKAMNEANDCRTDIVPEVETKIATELKITARQLGAGFSVAGAGNGGFVFSIAPDESRANRLENLWKTELLHVPDAFVCRPEIDPIGIFVRCSHL